MGHFRLEGGARRANAFSKHLALTLSSQLANTSVYIAVKKLPGIESCPQNRAGSENLLTCICP